MPARIIAVVVMLVAAAADAQAHTGAGIQSGFLHPILGWDHLIAMVGVGVWASLIGGSALWKIPLGFMTAMAVGGLMAIYSVTVPLVEFTILVSVVVISGLWLLKIKVPAWAGAAVVGFFAFAHGYAHGAEMPVDVPAAQFAVGFIAATGLLHGLGICLGQLLARRLYIRAG